jgi:NAD(P)H-hydrate repair Nnr-like enzyme with NAD(P)H-hydrate epimerase domain
VPTVSYSLWEMKLAQLTQQGLSAAQLVEGGGYSLALVVRSALGLTAAGGSVTVFASDSFYGWVSLAAARHLVNGGAAVVVVVPAPTTSLSTTSSQVFESLLSSLLATGAQCGMWEIPTWEHVGSVVEQSHNVVFGLADAETSLHDYLVRVGEEMNESRVPVHAVGAPYGLRLAETHRSDSELFASSTLSLGLPLTAIAHTGDLLGRHYLADLSWNLDWYRALGLQGEALFSSQPVIRVSCPAAE